LDQVLPIDYTLEEVEPSIFGALAPDMDLRTIGVEAEGAGVDL
jgi:hypothetical protein